MTSASGFRPRHLLYATAAVSIFFPYGAMAAVVYGGVAAGDMTSNDAILWTRVDNPAGGVQQATALTAQVSTDPAFGGAVLSFNGVSNVTGDTTNGNVFKIDATGLSPNTPYYYRFNDSANTTSPVGRFNTAPAAAQNVPVRFGFSGDIDGRFRPYPSVNGFGATAGGSANLNFFVFLGDTMYETAATGSPATAVAATDGSNAAAVLRDYHRKYLENISGATAAGVISSTGQQGVQSMLAATGTYTLLDNHELGNRQLQAGGAPQTSTNTGNPASFDVNTTGAFNNKSLGFQTLEQAYTDYHPIRDVNQTVSAAVDPNTAGTKQLYSATQWGKSMTFISVDDRSYRDIRLKDPVSGADVTGINANGSLQSGARADDPNRTMVGKTQLAWLKQTLLDAKNNGTIWKFLAISTPIDVTGGNQDGKSWFGGYRAERNDLLKFIVDNQIDHVVFLTTDDHEMRTTQLVYYPNYPDTSVKALVPGAFQVVTGPIGAAGPDVITDHTYANILSLLNTASTGVDNNPDLAAHGDPLIGPLGIRGLTNVTRVGDPNASANPGSIDFFSPDKMGYTTLDIDQYGNLTVNTWGIDSYALNTFPQPGGATPLIMSFTIGVPEPSSSLGLLGMGLLGLAGFRRVVRRVG